MTVGREGITFRDPGELADPLVSVRARSTARDSPLAKSHAWLCKTRPEPWDAQWNAAARRVVLP